MLVIRFFYQSQNILPFRRALGGTLFCGSECPAGSGKARGVL